MLNHKQLLRILTKTSIQISIEEYLFLLVVRNQTEEENGEVEDEEHNNELRNYIALYYQQNQFYGRDLYPTDESKFLNWNILIEKLVKQEYLLDYRIDKNYINFKELLLTDKIKNQLWSNDKESVWDDFYNFVIDKCGEELIFDGVKIQYFRVNQGDPQLNTYEKLKNYFWNKICLGGNQFAIGEFFVNLDLHISHNNGSLGLKVSNFLLNYGDGTLKKEIEKRKNSPEKKKAYKRGY